MSTLVSQPEIAKKTASESTTSAPCLTVIIPTTGRTSLTATIASVAPQLQDGDRVLVVCDNDRRFDFCSDATQAGREESLETVTWRCFGTGPEPLRCFGHPARNVALDLLAELSDRPEWCWSIDDDDVALFGALDMIRSAIASEAAAWYVFRMRGGLGSHFPGVTVPTMGETLGRGHIGTPMLVFPVGVARFGAEEIDGHEAGYFGDFQLAVALQQEHGRPAWIAATVAEIRPTVPE